MDPQLCHLHTEPVAPLRPFHPIAVPAQQLQVAGLVLPVVAQGHDVVDLEPELDFTQNLEEATDAITLGSRHS